jgi:mRNA interferase HigB
MSELKKRNVPTAEFKATWSQPADIKDQYRSASVLKNRRVVFNIKGNDYRLVVSVAYRYQAVYVKFIGADSHRSRLQGRIA